MRKFREMIFSGGNKGFTLIELLVVIAVLGILAGIAIPRISGVTDEARKAEMRATASSIRSAIELQLASGGAFPKVADGDITFTSDYNLDVNLENYSIEAATDGAYDSADDSYTLTLSSTDADNTYTVDISNTGLDVSWD